MNSGGPITLEKMIAVYKKSLKKCNVISMATVIKELTLHVDFFQETLLIEITVSFNVRKL